MYHCKLNFHACKNPMWSWMADPRGSTKSNLCPCLILQINVSGYNSLVAAIHNHPLIRHPSHAGCVCDWRNRESFIICTSWGSDQFTFSLKWLDFNDRFQQSLYEWTYFGYLVSRKTDIMHVIIERCSQPRFLADVFVSGIWGGVLGHFWRIFFFHFSRTYFTFHIK